MLRQVSPEVSPDLPPGEQTGERTGERTGECPLRVARPVMRMRWERLTFLHWPFDPDAVRPLLPPGLEVETVDGAAWVGLVPFYMRVAGPVGGPVPWASQFCETNVRTYVRDARGRSGVWFLSLDAARLGAVAGARAGFHLPYFWSRMTLRRTGSRFDYGCHRWWPQGGPTSRVAVSVGARVPADEVTGFEHFLTARWRLWADTPRGLRIADAEHPPWPLRRAELKYLDDGLVTAAGLPAPEGDPLVHWSPGVDVRISALRRLDAPDPAPAP